MRPEFVLIIALAALGTWALRYLPVLLIRKSPGGAWSRFLSAVGPAAIAALAVAAFLPGITPDPETLAPLLAGSAGVVAGFWWRRDVSVATLCGALAYGVAFALIGG